MKESDPPGRLRRSLAAIGRFIASNVFGLMISLLVFMALPFLQIVAKFGKKELEVREVAIAKPPPPPEIMEETPPEEPPEPEEKPELQEDMQPMSLSDLSLALNPGGDGGGGAKILSDALSSAVRSADSAFSMGDLDQKPRPLYQVAPKYPSALARQGVSGEVKVAAVIDMSGRVTQPRIVSSSNPLFNDPAMEAVRQWRFDPAVRDGSKVPSKIVIPIRFGNALASL